MYGLRYVYAFPPPVSPPSNDGMAPGPGPAPLPYSQAPPPPPQINEDFSCYYPVPVQPGYQSNPSSPYSSPPPSVSPPTPPQEIPEKKVQYVVVQTGSGQVDVLKKRVEKLEKSLSELSNIKNENENLKKKLEAAETSVKNLTNDVQDLKTENSNLVFDHCKTIRDETKRFGDFVEFVNRDLMPNSKILLDYYLLLDKRFVEAVEAIKEINISPETIAALLEKPLDIDYAALNKEIKALPVRRMKKMKKEDLLQEIVNAATKVLRDLSEIELREHLKTIQDSHGSSFWCLSINQIIDKIRSVKDDYVCSICCESMVGTAKDDMSKLDECKHVYHTSCINKWFKVKRECPQCRKAIGPSLEDFPALS